MLKNMLAYILMVFTKIIKGQFSEAFYLTTQKLPRWLISFNKATMYRADIDSFKLPDKADPDTEVTIATKDDIDDIQRICGWDKERIEHLLEQGGICLLAALKGRQPSSLSWLTFGRCFIRGIGYEFSVAEHETYGVGTFTLPEDRGKGLYLSINRAFVKYASANDIKTYYSIIEFTNIYSHKLRTKMGFKPIKKIIYLRLFSLKYSSSVNLTTNSKSRKIYFRMPLDEDLTIV